MKKISESDRRLHAGNHSVELLAQDFEKNYNMYIYPVHWQFAQLDQHPPDRCAAHLRSARNRRFVCPCRSCRSRCNKERVRVGAAPAPGLVTEGSGGLHVHVLVQVQV